MGKKITTKRNIQVASKKQGYWVNKDNIRKGERTIVRKQDKALVKRNRSGYDYDKTFTGYEHTQSDLDLQFAKKLRVEPRGARQDLARYAQNTQEAPVITAKRFFDFTRGDIKGIDTPKTTLKEEKKPSISEDQKALKELKALIHKKTNLSKKEIDKQIADTEKEFGDFTTEYGSTNIVAHRLGVDVEKEPETTNIISLSTPPITANKLGFPEKHSTKPEVAFIRQVIKDEYKHYYNEPCKMRINMATGTAYGTVSAFGSGDSTDSGITPKEYFILKKLGFNPSIGGQQVMVLSDNLSKVTKRLDDFQKNRTTQERNINSEIKELQKLRNTSEVIVDNEQYANAEDWHRTRIRMINKELTKLTKKRTKTQQSEERVDISGMTKSQIKDVLTKQAEHKPLTEHQLVKATVDNQFKKLGEYVSTKTIVKEVRTENPNLSTAKILEEIDFIIKKDFDNYRFRMGVGSELEDGSTIPGVKAILHDRAEEKRRTKEERMNRTQEELEEHSQEMEKTRQKQIEWNRQQKLQTTKPKPSSDKLIGFNIDDIDKETAERAYSFTSWDSDKRGAEDRRHYVNHLNNLQDELIKQVPPEKHAELKEALERYQKKYKEKTLEQLHRHSGLASSAVVGRSNFPVSSQKKKDAIYDRKAQEFLEWQTKAQRSIKRQFGLTKTGISSDDPEAIQKIDTKLANLKANHELMKNSNKVIRNKNLSREEKEKQLKALGCDDRTIHNSLSKDFAGRTGYTFHLTNNLANIKRLEGRKELLKRQRAQTTTTQAFEGVKFEDNVEDNRFRIIFDEKPSPAIISKLKSSGFHWSRTIGAWQRYRSHYVERDAKEIIEAYNKETGKAITKTIPKKPDTSKSKAKGKELYSDKYNPAKTHLALTTAMNDMQKRRLIKLAMNNGIDTREIDPSLKYDENIDVLQNMVEHKEGKFANREEDERWFEGAVRSTKLNTHFMSTVPKKERDIDQLTTEKKLVTEKDIEHGRKEKMIQKWKGAPLKSDIDIENIDDKWERKE